MKSVWMMQATPKVRAALVSTNSITQGEQVANIWKPLVERFGLHIDFAWRTFRWDSESSGKAHVHCVIIGFSIGERKRKPVIFEGESRVEAEHINQYLMDFENVWIEAKTSPLCNVPPFVRGCQPTDNGYLIFSEDEKKEILQKEPLAECIIRPFMMGKDFLQRKPRYCLWLNGVSPSVFNKFGFVKERIQNVRDFRLKST